MALAMAGVTFALGLAEVGFRLMAPMGPEFVLSATTGTMDNRLFVDDVTLRVVLAPNIDTTHYTTNALGIRSPELGTRLADHKRVLAIGDSFTLGMQVEDKQTFSALLTESLGPSIAVLNAGVPGYGTEQATGLMRRLVPLVQPDAVLLTIYTGNDLRDNARWAASPGMPEKPPEVVQPPPPQRSAWLASLAEMSRMVAYTLMFSDLQRAETDFRIAEFKDEILPFTGRDHLNPLMPPTRSAIRQFGDACRELRVRCGIAIVPPAFVVHTERLERTFEAFGIDADASEIDLPQAMIRGSVPHPMPVTDLTEALRTQADRDPYLIFDPHFSAEGHAVAADALGPFITKLLEIP